MAIAMQVPGFAAISINGALLGTSEDGIEYNSQEFVSEISGDRHGGSEGPPIDVQFLGVIYKVSITMTTWDLVQFENVEKRCRSITNAGTILDADVGKLYSDVSNSYILSWVCEKDANFNRSFTTAIPRGAASANIGTRHAIAVVEFDCHRNSAGVIWT